MQQVNLYRGHQASASNTANAKTLLFAGLGALCLVLVLAGPAVAVFLLARRNRRRVARESKAWFEGRTERVRRAILPGLPEAENKLLGRTWMALCVALGLFSLPFSSGFGFSLSLGYGPSFPLAWIVAALGLVAVVLLRYAAARSSGSRGV